MLDVLAGFDRTLATSSTGHCGFAFLGLIEDHGDLSHFDSTVFRHDAWRKLI